MKSKLKTSPTAKEKARSAGVTATVQVCNSSLTRLDLLIGQMVDLCETLVQGMDRASTAENINGFYKLSQSLAGLTRSRVDIEKLNLETKGLHKKAFESVQEHLRNELQGHPELVSGLLEVMDTVNDKIQTAKE